MAYVDGYVLPVPVAKLAEYKKLAQKAAKIWIEHGALQYHETFGDDLNPKFGVSFSKLGKAKEGDTIVFSYIVFKSRAHRDKVNAKVMADERLMDMCDPKNMPFDAKRMAYGGFKTLVEA